MQLPQGGVHLCHREIPSSKNLSINMTKTSMTLGESSCGHDLLPVTLYFLGTTGSGLKTLFMLLNVQSKRSALTRNALCKQLWSLHIMTF